MIVWQSNIDLKPWNTFGISVRAKWMVTCTSIADLREVIEDDRWKTLPRLVLGGGSNVLFTQDFDGVVLVNRLQGIRCVAEEGDQVLVEAAAGEVWHSFVLNCIQNQWAGVENLSLIPGSVGACPIQNIGAYGVEIKDVFEKLEAVHTETGELRSFDKLACQFGYRDSLFKNAEKGKWIITAVTFRLSKTPKWNIQYGDIQKELERLGYSEPSLVGVSQAVMNIRQSKLPDPKVLGNAGSFFKNPVIDSSLYQSLLEEFPTMPSYPAGEGKVKVPAGWLIEHSGWKGHRAAHCGVNEKQALVLVNFGEATGNEVYALSTEIVNDIAARYRITLEREVNIL
jgi:UDP-N-acetylmuramate dehydrogenase